MQDTLARYTARLETDASYPAARSLPAIVIGETCVCVCTRLNAAPEAVISFLPLLSFFSSSKRPWKTSPCSVCKFHFSALSGRSASRPKKKKKKESDEEGRETWERSHRQLGRRSRGDWRAWLVGHADTGANYLPTCHGETGRRQRGDYIAIADAAPSGIVRRKNGPRKGRRIRRE